MAALTAFFPSQGSQAYLEEFWPQRVAQFLQGAESLGPLQPVQMRCLPAGFTAKAYWEN